MSYHVSLYNEAVMQTSIEHVRKPIPLQNLLMESNLWTISVFALILANLVPLFGVLFFHWSLFSVMVLYWFENVVIGFYNVIRMRKAEKLMPDSMHNIKLNGQPYTPDKRGQLIIFFIIHYGMFTAVHGVFVWKLFAPNDMSLIALLLGVFSLFVSHGVSYVMNFVGKQEYTKVSAPDLFMQPYKRVVILHITIVLGAVFVNILSAPIVALLILVILKTMVDVVMHLFEHRSLQKKMLPETLTKNLAST